MSDNILIVTIVTETEDDLLRKEACGWVINLWIAWLCGFRW